MPPSPPHAARFPLTASHPARHLVPTAPESAPSSHFRGTRPANLTACSLLLRPPWVAVTPSILWIHPVFLMTLRLEAPAPCFQDPLQDPPVQVLCPKSTQLQAARHIHRWPLVSSASGPPCDASQLSGWGERAPESEAGAATTLILIPLDDVSG